MRPIFVRLLTIDDTEAVLKFEQENRAWFEQWVPPRPVEYFDLETLKKINNDLIAEHAAATAYMHLILKNDVIVGRINLSNIDREGSSSADVGYRIAENYVRQGIAVQALGAVEKLALNAYDLKILSGSCLETNPASTAVLTKNGYEKTAGHSEVAWHGDVVNMFHFRKTLT
jgi:ribosomal-protein-alanine N-acetyltransferase